MTKGGGLFDVDRAVALFTIRPEHADSIYAGTKRIELRKSYPKTGVKIIMLYETRPVAAITGAVIVGSASRLPVRDLEELAEGLGVSRARTRAYFGEYRAGWAIEIALALRFETPMPLHEMQELNHYFTVPQVFCYLAKSEALTQELMLRFGEAAGVVMRLRRATKRTLTWFRVEIERNVGRAYSDIDSDFVSQATESRRDGFVDTDFSTVTKHVLEVRIDSIVIGATVLTEKSFGAVKSGPTIMAEMFRGIGLGRALRKLITRYCETHLAAKRIYCTCPANAPAVVGYLLASGMRFQACLRRHLSPDRDEFVFAQDINKVQIDAAGQALVRRDSCGPRVEHVSSGEALRSGVIFILENLRHWYFPPRAGLRDAIERSIAMRPGTARFSHKPRRLTVAYSGGEPVAAVLATLKRSRMWKLNLVSDAEDVPAIMAALRLHLKSMEDVRRLYVTLPIDRVATIVALGAEGFSFEGVIRSAFVSGVDHVCMGMVVEKV